MRRSSILGFEKLVNLWQTSGHDVSLCQLLGLTTGGSTAPEPYSAEALCERFRDTWWEVIWPGHRGGRRIDPSVQCKYVADSFQDALRRCPHAEFLHVDTAAMFIDDPTEDEPDEQIPFASLAVYPQGVC